MTNFWHKLKPPILALAPMAGYTDSAFRLICKDCGADVVYSEMISVDAICHNSQKTLAMFKHNKKETPIVFQLFGSNPQNFAEALQIINRKSLVGGRKSGIDINFGCPAPKVYKTGAGASLMNNLETSYEIIKTVCKNTDLPVSIKIRSGIKDIDAVQFITTVKDLPFSAVMIHGRTYTQGFTGEINYEIIKQVKKLLPDKIVLANGGINAPEDAQKTLELTQADGLGLARGILGNPWLFEEIKKYLPCRQAGKNNKINKKLEIKNKKSTIYKHAKLFLKDNPNLIPLRKHFVHYFKGQKNASLWRQQIIKIENLAELKNILSEF